MFPILLLASVATAAAQQPAPLAPSVPLWKASSGAAAVALPDGGFIVGGAFRHASGYRRSGLVRFTAGGVVDETWSISVDGSVFALALAPDGDLIVGGEFAAIDGVPRANLAKIDLAAPAVDVSWQADTDVSVRTLLVTPAGHLFAGGGFKQVAGTNRTGLAKLDAATGALDGTWNPGMVGGVFALTLASDGALLVGGPFYEIGGTTVKFLAKVGVDGSGTVDSLWNPDPYPYWPTDLLADGQGAVYAAGPFFSIGGQSIGRLAKLSDTGTGAADAAWNPAPQSGVTALALAANGDIYAGGNYLSIDGQSLPLVSRLDPVDGSASAVLSSPPTGPILGDRLSISVGALLEIGGTLVIGGRFEGGGGLDNLGLARIDIASGDALPPRQYVYSPSYPDAITAQSNGGVVVAGEFVAAGEAPAPRRGLLRLTAHGALDPYWRADVTGDFGYVFALAEGQDGSVYAGGSFTGIGGVARTYLARLSAAGAVDPTWAPTAEDTISDLATGSGGVFAEMRRIQTQSGMRTGVRRYSQSGTGDDPGNWTATVDDGSIVLLHQSAGLIVGGTFATIGGVSRPRLARLDPASGQVDMAWAPTFTGGIFTAPVIDLAGDLLITGSFTHVNGVERRGLARLLPNGSLDTSWDAVLPGTGYFEATGAALGAQGSLYVTGAYEDVGGARAGVAMKLDSNTALVDASWDPQPDGVTLGVVVDDRDAVHVIGDFLEIGGAPRTSLAALPGGEFVEIFHSSFE